MSIPRRIVEILVSGRVQGVGYRAFLEDQAVMAGLDGWVRNLADGRVQAVLAGPPEAVEAVLAAARRGPAAGRVDALEVAAAEAARLGLRGPAGGFVVLPTARL